MPSPDANHPPADKTYRSAMDFWLIGLVAIGIGVPIVIVSRPGSDPAGALATRLIVGVTSLFLIVFFTWMYRTTRYTLGRDALFVHAGPVVWTIRYGEIRSLRPSWNPMAGPALSLRRLKITYGVGEFIVISPVDRPAFIAALKARAPQMEIAS